MDPCGRGFLVSAVMKSTPASKTGMVIRQSILERQRETLALVARQSISPRQAC